MNNFKNSVMNCQFVRVFRRELVRMVSRRLYFGVCVVLPLFCIFFMSTIFGNGQMENIPVGVVDEDNTSMSREVVRTVEAVPTFKVTHRYVDETAARCATQSKEMCIRDSPIRLEPSLNYFIENDNVSMLDVNMNLHYLCPVGRSVKLYPLFGFTFSNWMFDLGDGFDIDVDGDHIHIDKDDDHHNECRVGVNIGGGADFVLTNNWIMNFELRYQLVSDFDQAVFNLGFAYRF